MGSNFSYQSHPTLLSWSNLNQNVSLLNQISRQCGGFVEEQQSAILPLNPQFLFLAMFDECNEGTCWYKARPTLASLPPEVQGSMNYLQIDGGECADGPDAYLIRAQRLTAAFHQQWNHNADYY